MAVVTGSGGRRESGDPVIRVHATGCSLIDNLYDRLDFSRSGYRQLLSRNTGDGGLITGGLVFAEALAGFAGSDYASLLSALTGGAPPDSSNIGGPGIVPVIHAAQVCAIPGIRYRFAGVIGRDENGRTFSSLMTRAGFPLDDYVQSDDPTPCTDVLSDPNHGGGRGERTFINTIGAAGAFGPESLPPDFFDADMLVFGGTALVPLLHDDLDRLCRVGRQNGAFVMVNTVYDFRNEERLKGRPWPLVNDYSNIDLLVADREEAKKISGTATVEDSLGWFLKRGCRAAVVTTGADDVQFAAAAESRFKAPVRTSLPTCRYADTAVAESTHRRDTTGCGDNFVGGMIDSIAGQMQSDPNSKLDLESAVKSGVVAGSLALVCLGGVFYEREPGEKTAALRPFAEAYERELRP